MTLIKKSDMHRHISTGSRESRQTKRPYGADSTRVKSKPVAPPAEVKAEETPAPPKE